MQSFYFSTLFQRLLIVYNNYFIFVNPIFRLLILSAFAFFKEQNSTYKQYRKGAVKGQGGF